MIKNILFDFDGTIVDTSEGIIKCMNYAFEKLGFPTLNDSKIKETIGPPLQEMFKILLEVDDDDTIEKGVFYFRERYSKYGLLELSLYNNVKEILLELNRMDKNLFIVTSKPYEFTKIISENLGISTCFKDVSGVVLKGKAKSKSDRIGEILEKHKLHPKETIMVGDRQEDVLAAKKNDIETVGMLYGFGKKEDLESAGCRYFCKGFEKLKNFI